MVDVCYDCNIPDFFRRIHNFFILLSGCDGPLAFMITDFSCPLQIPRAKKGREKILRYLTLKNHVKL
jgi:hypothetical protein